jgi:hypothetical protein
MGSWDIFLPVRHAAGFLVLYGGYDLPYSHPELVSPPQERCCHRLFKAPS